MTHMIGSAMNPLSARWTHECVVMQGCHHRGMSGMRQTWKIERQVEQIVDMDDVGLDRLEDLCHPLTDQR